MKLIKYLLLLLTALTVAQPYEFLHASKEEAEEEYTINSNCDYMSDSEPDSDQDKDEHKDTVKLLDQFPNEITLIIIARLAPPKIIMCPKQLEKYYKQLCTLSCVSKKFQQHLCTEQIFKYLQAALCKNEARALETSLEASNENLVDLYKKNFKCAVYLYIHFYDPFVESYQHLLSAVIRNDDIATFETIIPCQINKSRYVTLQKPHSTPLLTAIRIQAKEFIKKILDYKPESLDDEDRSLNTALHYAIQNHVNHKLEGTVSFEIIKFLCDLGIDINSENIHGNTPLHMAACKNSMKLCKWLMDRGADPSIKNNNDISPAKMTNTSPLFRSIRRRKYYNNSIAKKLKMPTKNIQDSMVPTTQSNSNANTNSSSITDQLSPRIHTGKKRRRSQSSNKENARISSSSNNNSNSNQNTKKRKKNKVTKNFR